MVLGQVSSYPSWVICNVVDSVRDTLEDNMSWASEMSENGRSRGGGAYIYIYILYIYIYIYIWAFNMNLPRHFQLWHRMGFPISEGSSWKASLCLVKVSMAFLRALWYFSNFLSFVGDFSPEYHGNIHGTYKQHYFLGLWLCYGGVYRYIHIYL